MSSWRVLMGALAVDNLGSGSFLPLTILYLTQVVGLPLGVAGTSVLAATSVGLVVPLLVGSGIDRWGPRRVVVVSQVVQAAGTLGYLLAARLDGSAAAVVVVVVSAVLLAAGTQMFYSSLFSLVGATAGAGAKDRPFAVVDMVRSGAFGVGALLAGWGFSTLGTPALTIAAAVNALSFLVAAVVLLAVPAPAAPVPSASVPSASEARGPAPWRNRPFLRLLVVIAMTGLAVDTFLLGFAVFAVEGLAVPGWVPGVCVALLTAISATCALAVVHVTRGLPRTVTVGLGATLAALWAVTCLVAPALPTGVRPGWLIGSTVLLAGSGLLVGTRVLAMAEAAAPAAARGRYLATVQYAFNAAQIAAPGLVALFAVRLWVPWAAVVLASLVASALLPGLHRALPAVAVRPRDR